MINYNPFIKPTANSTSPNRQRNLNTKPFDYFDKILETAQSMLGRNGTNFGFMYDFCIGNAKKTKRNKHSFIS